MTTSRCGLIESLFVICLVNHAQALKYTAVDIGVLPNHTRTTATDINDSGVVTGYTFFPFGTDHATVWLNDAHHSPIDIGFLQGHNDSAGAAINNYGHVVGRSSRSSSGWPSMNGKAFVYMDGAMHDLNTLLDGSGDGWLLDSATDINDSGMIVGNGLHNDLVRAFLLVPSSEPDPTQTPVESQVEAWNIY